MGVLVVGCSDANMVFQPVGVSASSGGSDTGGGGGSGPTGGGFNPGAGGSGNTGGTMECGDELVGMLRDFKSSHLDFEAEVGTDKGIVATDLGADLKPVYAGNPDTPTTHGQEAFDQWYRDVVDVNVAIPFTIQLVENEPGIFTFGDSEFFPIDGQGFGDEGNAHNYHFTYEIHAQFIYQGGEVFTFTGDDDLFTFINGKLAIDLGGVHGPQSDTIELDQRADELGIVIGETYGLDFFFAERHQWQSNFRIDTSITCFSEVAPPN